LTRLRGWITRRGAAHDLLDAPKQGSAGAAAHESGAGTAHWSGETATQVSGARTAHGPGETATQVSGAGTAHGSGDRATNWRPVTWRPMRRPGGLALRVAAAGAVGVVAVVISGWSPGVVGVLAGVLTWLLATARQALARRRSQ
jgi:hypothetical protein